MEKFKVDMARGVDPLVKVIRTVYHSAEASANVTLEELKKQRQFIEGIAHIGFAHTRIRRTDFNVGDVPAEIIRPFYGGVHKTVILYCHGGGYTCGGMEYAGIIGTKLTAHTGFNVVTFAYRLAPEHKYPSQIQDAKAVWNRMIEDGIKPSNIIVAGDSAGGNLALELCLELKKNNEELPAALILFSPWTDMTASAPTYETEAENDPVVSTQYVYNARAAYLGDDVTDFKNPNYSPLFADLSGFPPTLIQVGKNEVLLHDSEALAARLKKQGTDVRLQVFKRGWHVFQQFPTPLAKRAMAETRDFLYEIVYGKSKNKLTSETKIEDDVELCRQSEENGSR